LDIGVKIFALGLSFDDIKDLERAEPVEAEVVAEVDEEAVEFDVEVVVEVVNVDVDADVAVLAGTLSAEELALSGVGLGILEEC